MFFGRRKLRRAKEEVEKTKGELKNTKEELAREHQEIEQLRANVDNSKHELAKVKDVEAHSRAELERQVQGLRENLREQVNREKPVTPQYMSMMRPVGGTEEGQSGWYITSEGDSESGGWEYYRKLPGGKWQQLPGAVPPATAENQEKGVLNAIAGTRQGESGWYEEHLAMGMVFFSLWRVPDNSMQPWVRIAKHQELSEGATRLQSVWRGSRGRVAAGSRSKDATIVKLQAWIREQQSALSLKEQRLRSLKKEMAGLNSQATADEQEERWYEEYERGDEGGAAGGGGSSFNAEEADASAAEMATDLVEEFCEYSGLTNTVGCLQAERMREYFNAQNNNSNNDNDGRSDAGGTGGGDPADVDADGAEGSRNVEVRTTSQKKAAADKKFFYAHLFPSRSRSRFLACTLSAPTLAWSPSLIPTLFDTSLALSHCLSRPTSPYIILDLRCGWHDGHGSGCCSRLTVAMARAFGRCGGNTCSMEPSDIDRACAKALPDATRTARPLKTPLLVALKTPLLVASTI
jgi:hypothetical protein